jgi:tetratricopeptide (TPR) repeat protein
MKAKLLSLIVLSVMTSMIYADEGMWIPGRIGRKLGRTLKETGLEIPFSSVYNAKGTSLKDAVVSFGGFCSGVVVSADGLVLTNHHCGFESIQANSSQERDYISEGFSAGGYSEELPNVGLYVRFLVRTEDVTKRVLKNVKPGMNEEQRFAVIDSVSAVVADEVTSADTTLIGVVDSFYGGNEFILSVYKDYNDVRLVFAPPASIGNFGNETDNWTWPRHTGDFCVFRIYADKNNNPAEYSEDNVPYHPTKVAQISLDGYTDGAFCMTMGYPGETERAISSYGIEERISCRNQAQIDVRNVKLGLIGKAMAADNAVKIKYASKYNESANYYKNSIGMNESVHKLKIIERKRTAEARLLYSVKNNSKEYDRIASILRSLEHNYKARRDVENAIAYFEEAFMDGAELQQIAITLLNSIVGDSDANSSEIDAVRERYKNLDADVDKRLFVAMANIYRSKVDEEFLPVFYQEADSLYNGDIRLYADALYDRSKLISLEKLTEAMNDTAYNYVDDIAANLTMELLMTYYDMTFRVMKETEEIERCERELTNALRLMNTPQNDYPDANGTMRFSFGTVQGYVPKDGVGYNSYTTVKGILEKAKEHAEDPDFRLKPKFIDLLNSRDFGRYLDKSGDMHVCFISNNDITGGNSGSAVFNGDGKLIGLAFDGNWEAMSSDVLFEPKLQRCINVDIRYILFIIEKYGKATRLIDELKQTSTAF